MKHMFAKYLSVLLIGALLAPAGLAEEDIIAEEPVIVEESVEESVEEPVEEIPEEPVEEVPGEPVEEIVEAVASEAVEAVVEEAADVELSEDVELEPESVEEVLLESPEEVVTEEPAAQAEAPAQQVVVEEPEAAAKVLAEGAGDIPIDEAHFPDPAFRQFVAEKIDKDPQNVGYLTQGEVENITSLGLGAPGNPYAFYEMDGRTGKLLWTLGITSLKGIEYFPNLQQLHCLYNPIASLDVSMLKNLVNLNCNFCNMTSLNISGCDSLLTIFCCGNQLDTLDVSNCAPFAAFPKGFKCKKVKAYGPYTKDLKVYSCKMTDGTKQLEVDKGTKVIGANGSDGVTNDPTGFSETPGVTITVNPGSTAKNTKASVVAAPGTSVQLTIAAGAKKFKSSNKKVAKVSKSGVVTFKKGGKVKITYKVGKKTRKVTLTVTDPTLPTAVAISEVNTEVKKGESVTLTPSVNEGANPGGYKWKSSNKKVATVKNGVVKFKKKGKVTITCTTKRGKKKARVTFAVSK